MSLWTCFEVSKNPLHSKLACGVSRGAITMPTTQKAGGAGVLSVFCRHKTETLVHFGCLGPSHTGPVPETTQGSGNILEITPEL